LIDWWLNVVNIIGWSVVGVGDTGVALLELLSETPLDESLFDELSLDDSLLELIPIILTAIVIVWIQNSNRRP